MDKIVGIDLTKLTWAGFAFETVSSIVVYSIGDISCQGIEGKIKRFGVNWDRTGRGIFWDFATGGGAFGWMEGLYLDYLFPGTALKPVLIKSALDLFVYGVATSYAFVYLYAWSQHGHEFAVQQVRDNGFPLVTSSILVGIPYDIIYFSTTGWTREIVSDVMSILAAIIPSYYVNRVLKHKDDGSVEGVFDDPSDPAIVDAIKHKHENDTDNLKSQTQRDEGIHKEQSSLNEKDGGKGDTELRPKDEKIDSGKQLPKFSSHSPKLGTKSRACGCFVFQPFTYLPGFFGKSR
eukprot:PhF_6_TR37811/c0_g1_i1/m.56296